METRVRLLGHSVHRSMIFLPLGLLAGGVGSDIGFLATREPSWAGMAFRLISAGILAAVFAATIGFLDWQGIPAGTRAKEVGKRHGIGNLIVIGLFVASWVTRGKVTGHEPSTVALILSFLGFGLAGITGWLGGELVSRLGVGVSSQANLNAPSSLAVSDSEGRATHKSPS